MGCERQLDKAARRLAPFAPFHRGVDLADLLEQVEAARGSCPSLAPLRLGRGDPTALARSLAFARAVQDACAGETAPFPGGRAFFEPSLPRVYDLNFVRVESKGSAVSADELAREADTALGARGLSHRRIVVHDEDLGAGLVSGFRALGWVVGRFLVMAAREPGEADPAIEVVELADAEYLEAYECFLRSDESDGDLVEQLLDLHRLTLRSVPTRTFAAIVDGKPVSWCELRSDGRTGQVEDVVTTKRYRRRGLAAAVVTHALREGLAAGHDLVFLFVDAETGPHPLYRRLGFEPVGLEYIFFRPSET